LSLLRLIVVVAFVSLLFLNPHKKEGKKNSEIENAEKLLLLLLFSCYYVLSMTMNKDLYKTVLPLQINE